MSERDTLNRGIGAAAALALLVAVMTSPIRPASALGTGRRAGHHRRNFAMPPSHSTRLCVTSVTPRAMPLKAVRMESEVEENSGAPCPAGPALVPPPPAPLQAPDRDWATAGGGRVPPPLRC